MTAPRRLAIGGVIAIVVLGAVGGFAAVWRERSVSAAESAFLETVAVLDLEVVLAEVLARRDEGLVDDAVLGEWLARALEYELPHRLRLIPGDALDAAPLGDEVQVAWAGGFEAYDRYHVVRDGFVSVPDGAHQLLAWRFGPSVALVSRGPDGSCETWPRPIYAHESDRCTEAVVRDGGTLLFSDGELDWYRRDQSIQPDWVELHTNGCWGLSDAHVALVDDGGATLVLADGTRVGLEGECPSGPWFVGIRSALWSAEGRWRLLREGPPVEGEGHAERWGERFVVRLADAVEVRAMADGAVLHRRPFDGVAVVRPAGDWLAIGGEGGAWRWTPGREPTRASDRPVHTIGVVPPHLDPNAPFAFGGPWGSTSDAPEPTQWGPLPAAAPIVPAEDALLMLADGALQVRLPGADRLPWQLATSPADLADASVVAVRPAGRGCEVQVDGEVVTRRADCPDEAFASDDGRWVAMVASYEEAGELRHVSTVIAVDSSHSLAIPGVVQGFFPDGDVSTELLGGVRLRWPVTLERQLALACALVESSDPRCLAADGE